MHTVRDMLHCMEPLSTAVESSSSCLSALVAIINLFGGVLIKTITLVPDNQFDITVQSFSGRLSLQLYCGYDFVICSL